MTKRFIIFFALLVAASPAQAQRKEIIQLQADIIRLTQQVTEIQRSLDNRNTVVQNLVEQLYDRVVSLVETVGRITRNPQ